MALNDRIKEARLKCGFTQEQLASIVGVAKSTITGYEKGNRIPTAAMVGTLADATNVDANFLYQDEVKELHENRATPEEFENIIKKYRILDSHGKDIVDMILNKEVERVIKLEKANNAEILDFQTNSSTQRTRTLHYYQRLASAGTGQFVFDDVPVDLIEIPDIPEYKKVKYAIGVNGRSMEPLYYDGDVLLVEPCKEIDIGEIGIFIVDGDSFVKKFGKNILISVNEDYSDIPISKETHCLGLVVDKISSPPDLSKQLTHFLEREIENYIRRKKGECKVYADPFAVFLNKDDHNYIEPDISVICDKNKLDDRGCNGSPDWVIEITSPSDPQRDYGIKLFKYRTAGVREYWIINPQKNTVTVFDFEQEKFSNQYSFDDEIPVCIYPDLIIRITDLLSKTNRR